MKQDEDFFRSVKIAVDDMSRLQNGMALLEFLKNICGYYSPSYSNDNPTEIAVAAGKLQVIQTLLNIQRLTPEQVLAVYKSEEEPQ
jgi:hypothetical protein